MGDFINGFWVFGFEGGTSKNHPNFNDETPTEMYLIGFCFLLINQTRRSTAFKSNEHEGKRRKKIVVKLSHRRHSHRFY